MSRHKYYYEYDRSALFKTVLGGDRYRRLGKRVDECPIFVDADPGKWEMYFVRVPNTLVVMMRLVDDKL